MERLFDTLLAHPGESSSAVSAVEKAIINRIAEFDYFIEDRDQLLHLCRSIASGLENRKEVIHGKSLLKQGSSIY